MTTTTQTISQHDLSAVRLAKLQTEVNRLAKRAGKLGVAAPSVEVLQTWETEQADPLTPWVVVVTAWATVRVVGSVPHLDGHDLLAVVERDPSLPEGPHVVWQVGDAADRAVRVKAEVQDWRHLTDRCDHTGCNGRRGRRKLFVFLTPEGQTKVIGSTCVQDYLQGVDPHLLADWLSFLSALQDLYEAADSDDDSWDDWGSGEVRVKLANVLALTITAIRRRGWVPRSQGGFATADEVSLAMFGSEEHRVQVADADLADAQAAIEWAQSLVTDDDYLSNVRAVAHLTTIPPKRIGLACSIVPAWQKAQAQVLFQASARKSEWVGLVGKREVFSGMVQRVAVHENQYGTYAWVTVMTDDGNIITWKASSRIPQEGRKISGKATVKAHEVWQEVRQTVVSRWAWEQD